jgi:hypothetical protein
VGNHSWLGFTVDPRQNPFEAELERRGLAPDKEIFGANDLDPIAPPLREFIDPLAMPPEPIKVRLWGVDAPEMNAPDGSGWAARKTMDSICRALLDRQHVRSGSRLCENDFQGPSAQH